MLPKRLAIVLLTAIAVACTADPIQPAATDRPDSPRAAAPPSPSSPEPSSSADPLAIPLPTRAPLSDCDLDVVGNLLLVGDRGSREPVWAVARGERYTISWPRGFVAVFDPELVVRAPDGRVVARGGDVFEDELGGLDICITRAGRSVASTTDQRRSWTPRTSGRRRRNLRRGSRGSEQPSSPWLHEASRREAGSWPCNRAAIEGCSSGRSTSSGRSCTSGHRDSPRPTLKRVSPRSTGGCAGRSTRSVPRTPS